MMMNRHTVILLHLRAFTPLVMVVRVLRTRRFLPVYFIMPDYDFDIQNYSIADLQTLFRLPAHGKYTADEVVTQQRIFYERIVGSGDAKTHPQLIRQLNRFLDEAGKLLVYVLDSPAPSRREPDIPLDYFHENRATTQRHAYPVGQGGGGLYDRQQNELIDKPPASFQMVMQNEFNPGKVNPIHTPVITKCLNIDTRFRDSLYSTQSSDFIFSLPERIRKVVSMQVSAYEFPVTFYSTSASYGNNFFNLFCTFYNTPSLDTSMTVLRTVTVPDGNYSAMDLITYINGQLCPRNAVDDSLVYNHLDASGIFNCVQLSLDLNSTGSGSGKIILQTSDQTGYTWSSNIIALEMDYTLDKYGRTDLVNITSKIGWNLGFVRPRYEGQVMYRSDTLPDPASIRYLYLVVNDFNNSVNNNFVGAFNRWILNNNILARIPVNGQYFNLLMENQLSQHLEPRKYFGPVDIQRLHIQVLDDHGRVLDINNANFSFCLTFKCLYD